MRFLAVVGFLVCFNGAGASDSGSGVTPIQKVLQMMEELKTKAKSEKEAEIQTFNEFTTFCRETIRAKGYAVKSAVEDIEKLEADIQKYDTDVMTLSEKVKKLGENVDAVTHEKAEAAELRKKETADYAATHADYVDQVADMEVGAAQLKKMKASTAASASASSFIQESSTRSGSKAGQEPAEPAFESQSDGVTDMMEGLKDKLLAEKAALEEEESSQQHAFQMTAQMFDQQIEKDSDERSEKLAEQKSAEASSADAKGQLADTTKGKADDETYTADLTTLCEKKSAQFEVRQQTRAEELKAIDQAMEIIGGQAVSGGGAKHLPQLIQHRASASFALAQLRSTTSTQRLQSAAAVLLKARAAQFKSGMLSMLAVRVSADPFVKVRKMIEDMIQKLNDEANDEAEHKGFCDEELANNQATRDEKNTKIDELTANIEELTAKSAQLSTDITTRTEEIGELEAAIKEATKVRGEEKEKNTATISDAKEAIGAVSQAVTVLKDFYAKAKSSTAFVQQRGPADDVPGTFGDEPFTGTGGEGGILGMLDVILSDFQRLEAETTATEAANAQDYDTFMDESKENRETKAKEVSDMNRQRSKTEHNIRLAKKQLKRNQEELDAAMTYYEKLKPSCVDAGVSYEDRVAQRENEIESLKESLKILEDEA